MRGGFLLSLCLTTALLSNPSSPEVTAGAAFFSGGAGSLLVDTTSDRTIIEWGDFSIGQGESVHFAQPALSSAVLNRVISASVSNLLGRLSSNGEVFLINPNGILVGNGGVVNVQAFVASSLDVLDAEFLAGGDMTFSGLTTASVENAGAIDTDGGAFLLGRHVVNTGEIFGHKGHVGLGAGDSILLLADKAGIMINLTVGTPSGTGIVQSGSVGANRVSMKANGNLYSLAIHHPGWASAHTTTAQSSEIELRADLGEVLLDGSAQLFSQGPNGEGGFIAIEGATVTLQDQTDVNTSNILGGGTIYIGGSAGTDPLILDALNTTVGENVNIEANAILQGTGGNVVVFGTGTADFAGTISAKGGASGGDGGVVEISGLGNLIFTGNVTTTAIKGETGLLILDPTDIVISNAATAGGAFDGGSPTNTFSGVGAVATLNLTDLNNALNANNVLVTTTSAAAAAGNFTWSTATPLTVTSSHDLTLQATNNMTFITAFSMTDTDAGTSTVTFSVGNNIVLLNPVTATNLAAVAITAGNNVLLDEAISASGATLTITAGNDIVSQGGADNTILANLCTFDATNNITLTNELNSTGNGAGSILSWTAGNQISVDNDCDFLNWGSASLSTTNGDIIIDQNIIADVVGTLSFNSGRDLINQGGTNLFNDVAIHTTDLELNAVRDCLITSQIDINNFNSAIVSAGRDVLITNDFEPDNTTVVTVSAGRDITISGAGNVIAANAENLNFIAQNDFSNGEPFSITNVDNVFISAGNDVVITDSVDVTGADTVVDAGNDVNILSTFTSTAAGDISVTCGNDLNVGPAAVLSQLGTRLGDLELVVGGNLLVEGGTGSGDRSQIGFNAALVDSNIELTVGGNVDVVGGTSGSCVAQIGHGFSVAGTYSGDIIIHEVGGDVRLEGGDAAGPGTVKFAQIGFARNSGAATSSFSGNIRGTMVGSPALIRGSLTVTGGGDVLSHALFGHGGRNSNAPETYSGRIGVQANAITLDGGTATDCNAAIGFCVVMTGGGANASTINNAAVEVISESTLTMTAQTDGFVSIGARVLNTASHASTIDLDFVDVETDGNLVMTSGTANVETDATIGAFAEFGQADTAITMDVGGDLLMTAQTVSPARIINGVASTAAKNVSIAVANNITPVVTGAFGSFIDAVTGNLRVVAGDVITMSDALTFMRNSGGSDGTLFVQGSDILLLDGGFCSNLGAGTSTYRTVLGSGDLTLLNGGEIFSVGSITGSIARNLTLLDNATITSTMGSNTFTVGGDITVTGGGAGGSSMTSLGSGFYLAGGDVTLSGPSLANEGSILNTTGTLHVFAGVDVAVNFFGRIDNLGTGDLTIVTDNLNPAPPAIGPGAFTLSALGSVGHLGGGALRVFTARRSQNSIEGMMNLAGETFTPGPLFVDSATEVWATYYPSSIGGSPFTIFYKDDTPAPPISVPAINARAFVPFSELFYILENRPMDPILAWLCEVCSVDCLCIPERYQNDPTLRGSLSIDPCRRLPPYLRKLDPPPFH